MDPVVTYTIAGLSGALVGLLLTLFGGGGSVLATPLLIYAVGVKDPHVAIGTSAAAVAVNAVMGLASQARAGRVKWPCAIVFGAAGLAGALTGAHLAKQIDGARLLAWFAAAMAAIGLSMLRRPRSAGDPGVHITPALALKLAPAGLATGLAAGFFGIGGGFLIVPALMLATGMPIMNAVSSSLVAVTAFGLTTAASYAWSGLISWGLAGLFVAGGVAGGLIGTRSARLLSERRGALNIVFSAVIIAVALYMLARNISLFPA